MANKYDKVLGEYREADTTTETDPLSLHLDQTEPQIVTAADTVITASDEVYFGDVTDSSKIKKDTVQGILDLVPAPDLTPYATKSFVIAMAVAL